MLKALQDAKVLVCIGTGGVGKTTVAAGLAWHQAKRGKRVLVLTVDPSQRLKTTMGLNVTGEWVEIKNPQFTGQLSASVMDVRKTFDRFIRKATQESPEAERILQNRLYQQLTTHLGGSQEFTALENLYQATSSGQFDLVILDTPPAQHAIDFLEAPEKLARIFTEGVARWFRDPKGKGENFWLGLVQTGTRQVLRGLEMLTGSEFMGELSEFFRHIHSWQGQLEKRAIEAHRLLVHPQTHFVLVTAFDEGKLQESLQFAKTIRKQGYHLSNAIVNRVYPDWIEDDRNSESRDPFYLQFREYYEQRRQRVAAFRQESGSDFSILEIPELEYDIRDLATVAMFSEAMEKAIKRSSEK